MLNSKRHPSLTAIEGGSSHMERKGARKVRKEISSKSRTRFLENAEYLWTEGASVKRIDQCKLAIVLREEIDRFM